MAVLCLHRSAVHREFLESVMKLKIPSLVVANAFLLACGGGDGGGGEGTDDKGPVGIDVANAPKGPASYVLFRNLHSGEQSDGQSSSSLTRNQNFNAASSGPISIPASCSTQPKVHWYNIGKDTANLIGKAVPEVGVLGSTMGFAEDIYDGENADKASGPSLCFSNTIAEINEQFELVQEKIQNIETTMNLTDEFIVQEIEQNSQSDLALAYQAYRQQIATVVGTTSVPGLYSNFVSESGIAATPSTRLSEIAANDGQVELAAIELLINGINIDDTLFDLSGAWYNRDQCANSPATCVGSIKGVTLNSGFSTSSLIQVMYEAKLELFSTISETIEANKNLQEIRGQQNLVELYQQYNKFITSLFHQSLVAVTADYYLLSTANQMNALRISSKQYQDPYGIEMPNISSIPGTYFAATQAAGSSDADIQAASSTNESGFEQAQRYLDMFYAGLVNKLYENVVGYLVTDFPLADQLSGVEGGEWDSGAFSYSALIGSWTMPTTSPVAGYSCWEATEVAYGSNGNGQWSEAPNGYESCKSAQAASGAVYSTEHVNFCLNATTYDVTTGCYKWASSAAGVAYPWTSVPQGAQALSYQNDITIENDVPYATIVAVDAFTPATNPKPSSGAQAGNPYFTMSNAQSSVIYQTPVIKGINTCLENYIGAVQKQVAQGEFFEDIQTNCPPILAEATDESGTVLIATLTGIPGDGNPHAILAPMYVDLSASPVTKTPYGLMYGVGEACQANSEFMTYIPTTSETTAVAGTPYLGCRLWKTTTGFRDEEGVGNVIGNAPLGGTDGGNVGGFQCPYNMSAATSSDWTAWTALLPPQPAGGSGLPGIGNRYITDASYVSVDLSTNPTASPYFTQSAGADTVEFSWPGNLNAWPSNLYFWAGAMNQNFQGSQPGTAHLLATSLDIDGFHYPLVYIFLNKNNLAGNGFAVVQNSILNNVGIVLDGAATPLTIDSSSGAQTPYTSQINGICGPGDLSGYCSSGASSRAVGNLTYASEPISPSNGLFAIINGIRFYFDGSINRYTDASHFTQPSNMHFFADWESLYVAYDYN
jgi:hypothetical protein